MSSTREDIELRIKTLLEGEGDIPELGAVIQALRGRIDAAGSSADAFSGELDDLAGKQALLQQFTALERQLQETEAATAKARATQKALTDQIVAGLGPSQQQVAAQTAAASQVTKLEARLDKAKEAQRGYTNQVIAADAPSASLIQRHERATAKVESLSRSLDVAREAQRQATAAVAAGSEPSEKLAAKHDRATQSVEKLTAQAQEERAELDRVRGAMDKAGVETATLGGAQDKLAADVRRVAAEIKASSPETLAQAYESLGVRSSKSLQDAASSARTAFETIRSSGTASARDLDTAFEAVVRAELEAAAAAGTAQREITTGMLRGQAATDAQRAAIDRVNAELDETGKKAVSTGEQLKKAYTALAGLAGITIGFQLVKDLASLADQAKEVESKLRLSAKGTDEFVAAQQGVLDIAMRTSGALSSTALLYTKLAEAARSSGRSQQDALQITEAINQAMAISGTNAQSAEAAITQLAQGLAAGTLRGDEFNSVAEQAPRLMQALADSLGVTKGELREMAAEGKLSSEVVLAALQSQAGKLAEEFAKVPLTLGRAMQQVKTALVTAIGELDEATGASSAAAEAIAEVARSLIDLANDQGIQTGLKAFGSAVGSVFDEVGAVLHAGQATFYTTASAVAKACQWIAEALALITTGDTSAQFDGLARSLEARAAELQIKVGDSLGKVQANMTDAFEGRADAVKGVGTALSEFGQSAEKSGDGSKKAAEEAKKAAEDIEKRLGPQVRQLIQDFDAAGKAGSKAGDDLEKMFAKIDTSAPTSIVNVIAALDELEARGKITGDALDKGIAQFLKGMTAEGLPRFQESANVALGQLKQGGEAAGGQLALLEAIINQAREDGLLRLGIDAKEVLTGLDKDTRDAISTIKALGANSATTGAEMRAAFYQVLGAADTKEEARAIAAAIKDIKIEGFDSAAAVREIEKRIGALPAAAEVASSKVRSAFEELGVTMQADLERAAGLAELNFTTIRDSGVARVGEIEAAFVQMAKAKLEAAVNAGEYAFEVDASMLTARAATDRQREAVRQLIETHRQQLEALDPVAQAYETLGLKSEAALQRSAKEARQAMQEIAGAGASAGQLQDAFIKVAEAELRVAAAAGEAQEKITAAAIEAEAKTLGFQVQVDTTTNSIKRMGEEGEKAAETAGEAMKRQAEATHAFAQGIAGWYSQVNNVLAEMSTATQALFVQLETGRGPQQLLDDVGQLRETIRQLGINVEETQRYITTMATPGLGVLMEKTKLHAAQAALQFHEQLLAARQLQEQLESNAGSIGYNIARAEQLSDSFDLLDQQDLAGLRSAISDAQSRMDALRNSAEQTLAGLQDDLDRLEGRETEIVKRRRSAQRDEIREQLKTARDLGDKQSIQDLTKALETIDKVTAREVADAKASEAAQRDQASGKAGSDDAATKVVKTHRIELPNGKSVEVVAGDSESLLGFVRGLGSARSTST